MENECYLLRQLTFFRHASGSVSWSDVLCGVEQCLLRVEVAITMLQVQPLYCH